MSEAPILGKKMLNHHLTPFTVTFRKCYLDVFWSAWPIPFFSFEKFNLMPFLPFCHKKCHLAISKKVVKTWFFCKKKIKAHSNLKISQFKHFSVKVYIKIFHRKMFIVEKVEIWWSCNFFTNMIFLTGNWLIIFDNDLKQLNC